MPKKTRAIKVTDQDKAWNRKSSPTAYRVEEIPINKTILIVCEGQTEELYFKSFQVLGVRVDAVNLGGQSKLKLVETTEMIQSDEARDEVWCVFDMDVRRGEAEFSDFDNAIERANSLGYRVAYSNDAFELWFYLHFEYTDAENHRTFYYQELGKRLDLNYEKDGKRFDFCKKVYGILKSHEQSSQEKAIERARILFEERSDLPYHQQNPVTKVFGLVEELNRNLRR
ncbi:RloB-like protein [Algoriphagus faecimaris]|uniref:RloB-like protein n=1 Tax=Algoriphagus faecimaris TaxID=686796 RepID=A0A1G6M503_9BACT|nr:RloB family protein [Algoriphagus faecimaris]SDC50437.1 RloB-like protein [Algoriphagus faecimaris]